MSDYFITLPCNASFDTFPDNTIGSYYNALASRYGFSGMEAALVELQYPNSWMTVPESVVGIRSPGNTVPDTFLMPEGKYNSAKEFVKEIQRNIKKANSDSAIKMTYDPITMKARVNVTIDDWELVITQKYANILGFKTLIFSKGITTGEKNVDLDEGMTALYVYSDIIQPQIVGHTVVPLLRVVPISGNRHEPYVTHEFIHPRYLPTQAVSTNIIQIHISRDDGRPVAFKSGKVIATLHVRPRRS